MNRVQVSIAFVLLICTVVLASALRAADSPSDQPAIGSFEGQADVGKVSLSGSAEYSPEKKQYRITARGENIWGQKDAFHFVYRKIAGDVSLSADVKFFGEGKNKHRKGCLMVREGLDADAPYVDVAVHGDGLISLQYRKTRGGPTAEVQSKIKGPAAVRLERKGDEFTLSVADKDDDFVAAGSVTIPLRDPACVGLAVSSHEADVLETAIFSAVNLHMPTEVEKRLRK